MLGSAQQCNASKSSTNFGPCSTVLGSAQLFWTVTRGEMHLSRARPIRCASPWEQLHFVWKSNNFSWKFFHSKVLSILHPTRRFPTQSQSVHLAPRCYIRLWRIIYDDVWQLDSITFVTSEEPQLVLSLPRVLHCYNLPKLPNLFTYGIFLTIPIFLTLLPFLTFLTFLRIVTLVTLVTFVTEEPSLFYSFPTFYAWAISPGTGQFDCRYII